MRPLFLRDICSIPILSSFVRGLYAEIYADITRKIFKKSGEAIRVEENLFLR